jgi:hypothetical protein
LYTSTLDRNNDFRHGHFKAVMKEAQAPSFTL